MRQSPTFIPSTLRVAVHAPSGYTTRQVPKCSQAKPPNDPSELRTESERRRNSPPKPMRRRRRRRSSAEDLDWDRLDSVPLVRSNRATPESGEDYWVDGNVMLSDADKGASGGRGARKTVKPKPIDEGLKNKLKEEVVTPYKQNWILRVALGIALLSVLVKLFGGFDTIPIISVPDL